MGINYKTPLKKDEIMKILLELGDSDQKNYYESILNYQYFYYIH